jgi:hypothetical protein
MELRQMDIMGGIWLADGRELKAVTGIDDHSRFCVAAGLIERANASAVCRVFTAALDRYGVPEELLTNNGKVFTGRRFSSLALAQQAVDAWIDDYNFRRPHQAIAMLVRYIPFAREAAALVSSRYERALMIVSANKPFSAWAEIFGDPVAVAAMVDRPEAADTSAYCRAIARLSRSSGEMRWS